MINSDDYISIDACHLDLIYGLVRGLKPKKVLELGFGTGRTTKTLLKALEANKSDYSYTLVENFTDWKDDWDARQQTKKNINSILNDPSLNYLRANSLICKNEEDAVQENLDLKFRYDFIVSDADHGRSDKWFFKTVSLIAPNGIGVFHDVLHKDYLNLRNNIKYCRNYNINFKVFSKSTSQDELCHRGLLVVFQEE